MKEIAHQNFDMWNAALQTRDAKKVAELYSADCTFLPTMSGEFKKGVPGAEAYFHHFLEKNPSGVIVEDDVQELGADAYLHSGHYNFELGPDGQRTMAEARFTYVWKKYANGEWKIIHHHSSVRPK